MLVALVAVLPGLLCPLAGGARDISVNVPLEHRSYRVIERFEARGYLTGLGNGIRPFSRTEMSRTLSRVDSLSRRGSAVLSAVEAEELRLLLAEFGAEAAGTPRGDSSSAPSRGTRGWPPLQYRHDRGDLWADLLLRQQTDLFSGRGRDEAERVFRNRVGGVVWGQVGDRLGFRIAFMQTREQGSRHYSLRSDVFERRLEIPQLKGDLADFHEGSAYVTFSLEPFADVEIGKDQVQWGPAPRQNLGLGSSAPAFDMVRLRARYGVFKLVSVAGKLRPCPNRPDSPGCGDSGDNDASYIVNGMSRTLEPDKYLAAHRLEAAVTPWLDLGFQEVVIYGDRGPEVSYLNPIMFYWAAQSYLGDMDNLMMGFDASIHPGNGIRVYAAYVVDDLKKLRVFSDDFVNKFSLQVGLLWVDPMGLRDVDLRAEYVRIEPWMYTHKYPINTFRHFDGPLGHPLGPNSDRWQVEVDRRFTPALSLGLHLTRTRHGSNELLADDTIVNVGGDLHRGWRPGDERHVKDFLAGNRHQWMQLGARFEYRPWNHLEVRCGYEHEWGNNVPLPPRWGSTVTLQSRTGYGDGGQHHLSLEARYRLF